MCGKICMTWAMAWIISRHTTVNSYPVLNILWVSNRRSATLISFVYYIWPLLKTNLLLKKLASTFAPISNRFKSIWTGMRLELWNAVTINNIQLCLFCVQEDFFFFKRFTKTFLTWIIKNTTNLKHENLKMVTEHFIFKN